ncbi:MAG: cell division protein FtsZ [Bacteroidales bacterium]|nr:cell division protein FtsZ [Bacteroidales bacterium]
MRDRIDFTPDYGTKQNNSIIKVIGVGGGGGNAVKHMYSDGIVGVDFLICNTDEQALRNNVVPSKLVLGDTGLGAGANPEIGRELAEHSIERIKEFIGDETQMLFITAGMGKGTGTGAAPVVAKVAHDMGILTIGVVTFPFKFEGKKREQYAEAGIAEMEKYVDSLIVVKNQKIMKYYGDEGVDEGFGHADDVLKNAVKCIAELITVNADQNIDFNDIKAIMQKSGHAMLGLAEAEGPNRIDQVVTDALNCPLLSEDVITKAQNFLFFISYGPDDNLKISELEALTEQFDKLKTSESDVIWGRAKDDSLGAKVRLSVIITNYEHENQEVKKEVTMVEPAQSEPNDAHKDDDFATFFNPAQSAQANAANEVNDIFASANMVQQPVLNVAQSMPQVSGFAEQFPQAATNLEPVMVAENSSMDMMQQYGPQQIGHNSSRYEDNDFFNELVNTPAILRGKRQEDLEAQQNRHNFELDNDMSDFFKDIPD